MNFEHLHVQKEPLLICNVWDVASAKVAEAVGFQAIATSSGAIASMLGYQDGEEMTFAELHYIVKRITECVKLPLSVDMEAGYDRDPEQIAAHVSQLLELGIVGVNLEDSLVQKERHLLDGVEFANHLAAIISHLGVQAKRLFINVRTDTYLLGIEDALQQTLERAQRYQAAGADGLFVPCLQKEEDIRLITKQKQLPLNVMCVPNLPAFSSLQSLGVKRISMGNFVQSHMLRQMQSSLQEIVKNQAFSSLFQ